jgi:hypothetical protein
LHIGLINLYTDFPNPLADHLPLQRKTATLDESQDAIVGGVDFGK